MTLLAVLGSWLLTAFVAQAQTFSVIHNFTGGGDGGRPYTGLTADAGGNLYGTSGTGGLGYGTVFKLSHRGSGWILSTLYTFGGSSDGASPHSRVVFGPDGALYGTAQLGGSGGGGTVFKLQPPNNICAAISCPWTERTLYSFRNYPDGAYPGSGDVVFDHSGNLYGATMNGGTSGFTCADDSPCGTVYKLVRSQNEWAESVLYNFRGEDDGAFPNGVILDNSGNFYGTTSFRGVNVYGTVFSLTPDGHGGWSETSLYAFSGGADGGGPMAGVIPDGSGGFLGTTAAGGSANGGTTFQLSASGGSWLLNTLNSFSFSGTLGIPPPGPSASLVMDASGNLYGTTVLSGAFDQGSVFKLSRAGGGWTYTTLHDFTGGADGGQPFSNVVFDSAGNLYGTASIGGSSVGSCYFDAGCGVVWKITP